MITLNRTIKCIVSPTNRIKSQVVSNTILLNTIRELSIGKMFRSVTKALGIAGTNKSVLRNANAIFYNCQRQAANKDWFIKGKVGGDFRSKHSLIVLHIWMIHQRLLLEGKKGLQLQEALFDELWEDTSNRIRGQGVNELSVNKYLKVEQSISFRFCVELDYALSLFKNPSKAIAEAANTAAAQEKAISGKTSTSTSAYINTISEKIKSGTLELGKDEMPTMEELERIVQDEIGGVLWRMVYMRKDNIDVDHVLKFAKYVRDEQQSLLQLPVDAVFEGRIEWGPLPAWPQISTKGEKVKITKKKSDSTPSGVNEGQDSNKSAVGEWREATAPDGRTYYWNTATRQSQWEKP